VDVSNNALTLKQCLELKDDLPVVTATELADPKTALGLSLEQAQLYVSHYTARLKNLEAVADEAPWGVQNQVQEQDAKICDLQARLAVQEALLVKVLEAVQGIQAWTATLPSESKYEPSWDQGGFPAGEVSMPGAARELVAKVDAKTQQLGGAGLDDDFVQDKTKQILMDALVAAGIVDDPTSTKWQAVFTSW
jgi:hypothetical protein